jgi:hypothetical protein
MITGHLLALLYERGIAANWNKHARLPIELSIAVIPSEIPIAVVSFARYAPVVIIEIRYARAHLGKYIFALNAYGSFTFLGTFSIQSYSVFVTEILWLHYSTKEDFVKWIFKNVFL